MNISRETLIKLFFNENKSIEEVSRICGTSPLKIKKIMISMNISLDRTKKCGTCNGVPKTPPLEGSGGMSFELTKD